MVDGLSGDMDKSFAGKGQGMGKHYGPGDGTGMGVGPADGTGFGPGLGTGDCDGSGQLITDDKSGGVSGRRGGRR